MAVSDKPCFRDFSRFPRSQSNPAMSGQRRLRRGACTAICQAIGRAATSVGLRRGVRGRSATKQAAPAALPLFADAEVDELTQHLATLQPGVAFIDVVQLDMRRDQVIEFQAALLPGI